MVCVRLNPVKGIGEVSSVRMSEQDAIALTRALLRFETVNPPGRERDCARHAGALLEQWGFRVEYHEYAEARTSVIARAGGSPSKAPLCLTGHLDVVPLGARAWTRDPFAGETQGDRLYGRGSSDMKAGVAARSEEHTSELQSPCNLVCRLLLEKKKKSIYKAVTR